MENQNKAQVDYYRIQVSELEDEQGYKNFLNSFNSLNIPHSTDIVIVYEAEFCENFLKVVEFLSTKYRYVLQADKFESENFRFLHEPTMH